MKNKKIKVIKWTGNFPEPILDRLKEIKDETYRSVNSQIIQAIEQYLKKQR
jgi:hypothetical protein